MVNCSIIIATARDQEIAEQSSPEVLRYFRNLVISLLPQSWKACSPMIACVNAQ